jgi:hypothetical protein
MTVNPWRNYPAMWHLLTPPMRPHAEDVRLFKEQSVPGKVLLLGVTPELHAAFDDILAVDRDGDMIAKIWPGDTDSKRVTQGNWQEMDWPDDSFSSIIGDFSIMFLHDTQMLADFQARCLRWLKPGGTMVQRVFFRPDDPVTLEDLNRVIDGTKRMNFHAFRWYMAQYLAEQQNSAGVLHGDVYKLFNTLCPDRSALLATAGWDSTNIESVELYKDSTVTIGWHKKTELLSTIPAQAQTVQLWYVPGGTYDLDQYCPVMRWNKPL